MPRRSSFQAARHVRFERWTSKPRAARLVGSCGLTDTTAPHESSFGMLVRDHVTPSKKPSRDATESCHSSIQVNKTCKATTNLLVVLSAELSSNTPSLPLPGSPFLYLLIVFHPQRFREG